MGSIHKQPFISSGDFVVRKAFTFDGDEFKTDDDFPYGELDCEPRKLRNLYEAGYIKHRAVEEETSMDDDKAARAELRKQKKLERKLAKKK